MNTRPWQALLVVLVALGPSIAMSIHSDSITAAGRASNTSPVAQADSIRLHQLHGST